jgi:hypothetical protein
VCIQTNLASHFSSPCQLFGVSDKFGVISLAIVQLSWSKSLVRKWLNIKSKGQDVQVDCYASRGNDIVSPSETSN